MRHELPKALALELIEVCKSFGAFRALDRANLAVARGEVHALLGENGAGKSSLMNIATGLYRPDSGHVRVDGRDVDLDGPALARAAGIGMVHQHFKLVACFSVAENVALGNPSLDPYGRGREALYAAITDLAQRLGLAIDPDAEVGKLAVGAQQRVEIIKVLLAGARVLILDEPTAVLAEQEANALLTNICALSRTGTAVVLVTHKLREVEAYCDRVSVMRQGRTVETIAQPARVSRQHLTKLVVGAEVEMPARGLEGAPDRSAAQAPRNPRGRSRLYVADLCSLRDDGHEALRGASFHVRDGEIYGIAGVSGNGQEELVEIIMGLRLPTSGAADLAGVGNVSDPAARGTARSDIAFIPADRYRFGLAASLPVDENYAIRQAQLGAFGGWAWLDRRAMRKAAQEAIVRAEVQGVRSLSQPAALLSGGNAQKLVLAREIEASPSLVMAHNPGRGLDVRASAAVRGHLLAAAKRGAAVLLLSEDLDESLALCDRIGVMASGRIVAEFESPFDRLRIGEAMVAHDGA